MIKNQKRQAFTLVELLVVIAIIVILAAILFPVFARARENARRAGCQSDMKQLALASMMYVQDNDGRYNSARMGSTTTTYTYWWTSIEPYVKNWQIMECPSFNLKPYPGEPINAYPTFAEQISIGLVRNSLGSYAARSSTVFNIPESAILHPAELAWYSDGSRNGGAGQVSIYNDYGSGTVIVDTNSLVNTLAPRHFDGVNIAFVDGHVKWMKAENVYVEVEKTNQDTSYANDCQNRAAGICSRLFVYDAP